MTPDQVVKHFQGVAAAAEALRVTRQAVAKWQAANMLPSLRELQVHHMTKGKLLLSYTARRELNL